MIRREKLLLLVLVSIIPIWSMTACNKQPAPQAAEPVVVQEPDIEHSVRYPGETLAVIAKWYTGRSTNWNAILDNNPGLRPERINLGQVIMIPRSLIVEERPMPREFLKSVVATRAVAKEAEEVSVETAPPQTETPERASSGMEATPELAVTDPGTTGAVAPSSAPATDAVVDPTPPSSSSAPAVTDDKEREKLLDELLQQ